MLALGEYVPGMTHVQSLQCVACGRDHDPAEVEYTCSDCGLEGILDVRLDYDRIRRHLNRDTLRADPERSIWRYGALLPLPAGARLPSLQVGFSPIYSAPRLAQRLGIKALHLKDDGRNPTGSYKDRASAVGVARAVALGRSEIACASTGNAASSLAGFAADMGVRARIFVPADAPQAKVAQLLVYGATVFLVEGGYGPAFELCQSAVQAFGWYNRNCAVNPYLVEGKKTGGLEIAEQMQRALPDVVLVPVGDGCIISGVGKGLEEMRTLGIIDRLPRLIGVQAVGAAPIAAAFHSGADTVTPMDEAHTLADSINVGTPRNWRKALGTVRRQGGAFVTVSDEAITAMIQELGASTGVFAEPTAVAAVAGIQSAREKGLIGADESVLALLTGNGLKDVRGALRAVRVPAPIPPNLEEVRRAIAMA